MRVTAGYLERASDDVLAAARMYCWDVWLAGWHPLEAESMAARMFALTSEELTALGHDWGSNPRKASA